MAVTSIIELLELSFWFQVLKMQRNIKRHVLDVCADVDHARIDDQLQQNLPEDSTTTAASKTIPNEDESKGLFDNPVSMICANIY